MAELSRYIPSPVSHKSVTRIDVSLAHFDSDGPLKHKILEEGVTIDHTLPFQTVAESYAAYQRLKAGLPSNKESELPYKTFYCQLSGKVMKDPVMTSSNRIYERDEITRWIHQAQLLDQIPTDPITNEVLLDVSLKPIKSIRETIDEWRVRNTLICKMRAKQLLSDEGKRLQVLKQLLDVCQETEGAKQWVFFENLLPDIVKCLKVRNLDVKRHTFNLLRLLIMGPGQTMPNLSFQITEVIAQSVNMATESLLGMSPLLEAVEFLKELVENKDPSVLLTCQRQNVIGALVTCITTNADLEVKVIAEDILSMLSETGHMAIEIARFNYFTPFLKCLQKGSEESRQKLVTFMAEMTLSREAVSFFVHNNVIADLVVMVNSAREDSRFLAIRALQNLSWHKEALQNMTKEGLVADLLEILSSKASLHHKISAASVLEKLITKLGVVQVVEILKENILPKLVSLLCSILGDLTLPLNSTSIHIFLLRILTNISQDSIHIRDLIRAEEGCSDLLLNLLKPNVPEMCVLALNLLSVLCDGNEGSDMASMISQNVMLLLDLLEKSISMDVQNAITAVLSRLSYVEQHTISFLALSRLIDLSTLSGANGQVQTLAAILLYVDDLRVQQFLAQKGFIVTLVEMLSSSTTLKTKAALILKAFSSNSYKLLNDSRKQALTLRKPCPVHNAHCRVKTNFCVVQAGAVTRLVQMLDDQDSKVAEASLDVLSTLIETDQKHANAACFLDGFGVTDKAVQLAMRDLGACSDKSLDLLSRLFTVVKIKNKHAKTAILLSSGCEHNRCLSKEAVHVQFV